MLCPLLLAALPQGAVIPDQPALVEVKHGRARVVAEGGDMQLTSLDPATVARGAAYLEVTAGSVVFVSWRGLATLRFEGPAAFEWGGESAGGVLSWRAIDVAALEAEVRRGVAKLELPMGWQADFEAGAYHLRSLPDGGTQLVHAAGEDLRIRHMAEHGPARPPAFLQAGQTARLASPPQLVGPPDLTASAPAWGRYEWPWGVHGIPGRPDLGAGGAWSQTAWPFGPSSEDPGEPWPLVEWPWQAPRSAPARAPQDEAAAFVSLRDGDRMAPSRDREAPDPVDAARVEVFTEPATDAAVEAPLTENDLAAESPAVSDAAESPAASEVTLPVHSGSAEVEPAVTAEPADPSAPEVVATPEAGSSAPSDEAASVHVVVESTNAPETSTVVETPAETVQVVAEPQVVVEPPTPKPAAPDVVMTGPLRHKPNAELRFEERPDGQWTVSLPEDAAASAQILGERFDTWIRPGGSIQVDAKGKLIYHLGPVEMRPSER